MYPVICSWNIKLANLSPVATVLVSNAIWGSPPIKFKTVVRTASCTRGDALAVNRDIKSEGVNLETTFRYGFVLYVDNEDESKSEESDISIPGMEVEVDAQSYLSELRGEVNRLRDELDNAKQTRDEEIRKDLLMYIRTLPPQELQQLTGTMSPEVLEAMKGLVTAVLAGITEDDEDLDAILGGGGSDGQGSKIGPNTVTEQSGEALAQLCMWQLVVGFNLRELEVRDSMKKNLLLGDIGKDEGNDFPFGPGALE